MIEFALAAAGLVAIAFVVSRVAVWMNQAMVDRNESYQQTRLAAGSASPGRGFAGPARNIHLIGPGPASTGQQPAQGAGPALAGCPAAANAKLAQASADRAQADQLSSQAKSGALGVQDRIESLQQDAERLVIRANYLWADAQLIKQKNAQLAAINSDGWVQGINGKAIIVNGVETTASCSQWCLELIDERIAWIDRQLGAYQQEYQALWDAIYGAGGVNQQIADLQSQAAAADNRIATINSLLTQDAAPLGTTCPLRVFTYTFSPVGGITSVIDQIKAAVNAQPDQCEIIKNGSTCDRLLDAWTCWDDQQTALTSERDTQWYWVPGVSVPAIGATPGFRMSGRWVQGLAAKRNRLNALWQGLQWYRDNVMQPRIDWLLGQLSGPLGTERSNLWSLQRQRDQLWADIDGILRAWQPSTGIYTSNTREYQFVPGWYESKAREWRAQAQGLYDQASDLIYHNLDPNVSYEIQRLLDEAWKLEEEARIMCSSGQ